MAASNVFVATEVFADVLDGAKVISVDPGSCIPFIQVRAVVKSGVQRIKFSYCENDDNAAEAIANGAVCGTSMPTVVVLSGAFAAHVQTYFMEEHGLSKEEAELRAQSRKHWYGVVDGVHRLFALLQLQQERPQRWAGFQWSVLLLQGVQSEQSLRAFARSQNLRERSEEIVETTMYDQLYGLQQEVRRLRAESGGRDPSAKQLADRFSASPERTSSSLRIFAIVALKLSERIVSTIGEIMNFECPRLACSYYSEKGRPKFNESSILNQADCRVYRNFITISSLRLAPAFLNAKGGDAEDLQVNTLFRLRELCRNTGFKPVAGGVVLEQFSKATAAFKEGKKFERLLRSPVWPRGMEKLQENLLRTTVLDDDVTENEGNEVDILQPIIQHFRRCVPQKAALLEAHYFSTMERDVGEGAERATNVVSIPGEDGQDRRERTAPPKEMFIPEEEIVDTNKESDGHELLQKHGITCFEMSWQQYNRTLHSNTDALFDLVLTEPPRGLTASKARMRKGVDEFLDKREMQEFASFAQRVLVPGGYLLLFTMALHFKEWLVLLRANDFTCMEYPFVIAKDSKGVQRENRHHFPQNVCEQMIMAVSRGRNSKGFEPDFKEAYKLVPSSYKRKFAAIDRVPVVRSRLRYDGCRSVVCTSEKNPDMLAELLVTFSPPGANVLDPYAGSMSTGTASLATNRRCTLIEKDPECFSQAFKRLLGNCKAQSITSIERAVGIRHSIGNVVDAEEDGAVEAERGAVGIGADSMGSPAVAESAESDQENYQDDEYGDGCNAFSEPRTPSVEPRNNPENCEEFVSSSGGGMSIPSVPSSPVERPTQCSQREEGKVKLIMLGDVVATADIAIEHDDGDCYRRTLHGHNLSKFRKDDEDLVVVWNVRVGEACMDFAYPYSYGGIEGPISYLREMETGFHAWDLNAMRLED